MLEQIWKLKPLKTHNYYEQVLIHDKIKTSTYEKASHYWYPFAMVHIDGFHSKESSDVYDLLNAGEEVIVKARFEVLDE